jgi:hypothetical protein
LQQARLADAALAADQHDASGAAVQPPQPGLERLELVLASGEAWPVQPIARPAGVEAADVGAKPEQHRGDLSGVARPLARALGQQTQQQRVQLGRHLGHQLRRRDGLALEMLQQDLAGRAARERRPAGDEPVQQAAQRVQVRARIDGLAAKLLGRDRLLQPGAADHLLERLLAQGPVERRSQSEVQQHRTAVRAQDDSIGREALVHEPFAMHRAQGAREAAGDAQGQAQRQALLAAGPAAQGHAFERSEGVPRPAGVHAGVEQPHHSSVAQATDHVQLAAHRGKQLGARHPEHLDDGPHARHFVPGLPEHARAQPRQGIAQPVGPDRRRPLLAHAVLEALPAASRRRRSRQARRSPRW